MKSLCYRMKSIVFCSLKSLHPPHGQSFSRCGPSGPPVCAGHLSVETTKVLDNLFIATITNQPTQYASIISRKNYDRRFVSTKSNKSCESTSYQCRAICGLCFRWAFWAVFVGASACWSSSRVCPLPVSLPSNSLCLFCSPTPRDVPNPVIAPHLIHDDCFD